MVLLGMRREATIEEQMWFRGLVESFSIRPGLLCRYLGETTASSWDDHIGVACACYVYDSTYAKLLWAYGIDNNFMYTGDPLGRFPFFMPTLKACAGMELTLAEQIMVAGSYIENLFEARGGTSGKILLWHRARVFVGKYWLLNFVIGFWAWRMMKLYPKGLKDIFTIYFGAEHPLAKYMPEDMGGI